MARVSCTCDLVWRVFSLFAILIPASPAPLRRNVANFKPPFFFFFFFFTSRKILLFSVIWLRGSVLRITSFRSGANKVARDREREIHVSDSSVLFQRDRVARAARSPLSREASSRIGGRADTRVVGQIAWMPVQSPGLGAELHFQMDEVGSI